MNPSHPFWQSDRKLASLQREYSLINLTDVDRRFKEFFLSEARFQDGRLSASDERLVDIEPPATKELGLFIDSDQIGK